jgi:hypothetical protein
MPGERLQAVLKAKMPDAGHLEATLCVGALLGDAVDALIWALAGASVSLLANSSTSVGIMDNMARLRSRDLFPSEEPVRPPGKLIGRRSDVEELASQLSE